LLIIIREPKHALYKTGLERLILLVKLNTIRIGLNTLVYLNTIPDSQHLSKLQQSDCKHQLRKRLMRRRFAFQLNIISHRESLTK